MSEHYVLEGRRAVPVDLMTWARWLEKSDRVVAITERDGVKVSTVFLGLDHSFGGGPPQIFETLVFEGDHDGDMDRYSTWEEAEAGHAAMVEKVFGEPTEETK